MNPSVQNKLQKLKPLCIKYRVDRMHLFGSQANDTYTKASDIDLLVKFSDTLDVLEYSDNFFELLEKLEALFNQKVDLVAEKSLKNPILIEEIEKSKIVLI